MDPDQAFRDFENHLTGDYTADPEGQILSCNGAFARIFGLPYKSSGMEYRFQQFFQSAADFDRFLTELQSQRKIEYLETELVKLDGTTVYVIQNAIGEFDETGVLKGIQGHIFDDTRRRLLEAHMIQSQKMESLATLVGGIAHDFNNILTIILGHGQFILTKSKGQVHDHAMNVVRATRRGTGLVRQLLTFATKTEVVRETISLKEIIRELEDLLKEAFPKNLRIQVRLANHLPPILGDSGQIYQLLLNLCLNARDAMPNGGSLTISANLVEADKIPVKQEDSVAISYIQIMVHDTGSGMDEQTRVRVFEPFFTTKPRHRGTGLGLATVYGIVKGHGGAIEVNSLPGLGTQFDIYLPVEMEQVRVVPTRSLLEPVTMGGNETILIVDDEDQIRSLTKMILEGQGYVVLCAGDGEQAMEMARENREQIQLVVTDIGLPKMSGEVLAVALREMIPGVCIIITTGYVDGDHKNVLLECGVKEILLKPFDPDLFLRTVRKVLDEG